MANKYLPTSTPHIPPTTAQFIYHSVSQCNVTGVFKVTMATKHTGAAAPAARRVPRVSPEEDRSYPIRCDKDNLVFLFAHREQEVFCNVLDLQNCSIIFQCDEDMRVQNRVIVKASLEEPKRGHYETAQECAICMEQMKFVNYKAKAAFNTIARQRNKRIEGNRNTSPCGKTPRSTYNADVASRGRQGRHGPRPLPGDPKPSWWRPTQPGPGHATGPPR